MPPHGYILESENYFDPFSNNKNTVDSGFASSVISKKGNNNPTYVKKGQSKNVTLQDFEIRSVIGTGSKSKVYLV